MYICICICGPVPLFSVNGKKNKQILMSVRLLKNFKKGKRNNIKVMLLKLGVTTELNNEETRSFWKTCAVSITSTSDQFPNVGVLLKETVHQNLIGTLLDQ